MSERSHRRDFKISQSLAKGKSVTPSPKSLEEAEKIVSREKTSPDAKRNLIYNFARALDRAKAEQREEDARIAEEYETDSWNRGMLQRIASAIRSTAKEEK